MKPFSQAIAVAGALAWGLAVTAGRVAADPPHAPSPYGSSAQDAVVLVYEEVFPSAEPASYREADQEIEYLRRQVAELQDQVRMLKRQQPAPQAVAVRRPPMRMTYVRPDSSVGRSQVTSTEAPRSIVVATASQPTEPEPTQEPLPIAPMAPAEPKSTIEYEVCEFKLPGGIDESPLGVMMQFLAETDVKRDIVVDVVSETEVRVLSTPDVIHALKSVRALMSGELGRPGRVRIAVPNEG